MTIDIEKLKVLLEAARKPQGEANNYYKLTKEEYAFFEESLATLPELLEVWEQYKKLNLNFDDVRDMCSFSMNYRSLCAYGRYGQRHNHNLLKDCNLENCHLFTKLESDNEGGD